MQKIFSLEDRVFLLILLCLLLFLPLLFFFMNYIGFSSRAWVKSRFLEIPIYLILCICFYFASRYLRRSEIFVLILILIIYSIIPFIATNRPQQLYLNLKSLKLKNEKPLIYTSSQHDIANVKGIFALKQPGWHSIANPTYPQSITIDFKKNRNIQSLAFLPQDDASSRAPKDISIISSSDNISWNDSGEYSLPCSNGWHKLSLDKQINARYLQIIILSNCGDTLHLTLRGLKVE